jgi:myotubularin-related protein 14
MGNQQQQPAAQTAAPESLVEIDDDVDEEDEVDALRSGEWQLFDKVRNQDIKLLKLLNIGTIIDFMVEKKKIKFGV